MKQAIMFSAVLVLTLTACGQTTFTAASSNIPGNQSLSSEQGSAPVDHDEVTVGEVVSESGASVIKESPYIAVTPSHSSTTVSEPQIQMPQQPPPPPAQQQQGDCSTQLGQNKPDAAHFIAAAKVDNATAATMLYGVIGANGDSRDWKKIMASSDVAAETRKQTLAMYSAPYCRASYAKRAPFIEGNFELTVMAEVPFYQFQRQRDLTTGALNYWVAQVDYQGYMLTTFANCSVIAKRANAFGTGVEPVRTLANIVQQMNIDAQANSYFYSGCF